MHQTKYTFGVLRAQSTEVKCHEKSSCILCNRIFVQVKQLVQYKQYIHCVETKASPIPDFNETPM